MEGQSNGFLHARHGATWKARARCEAARFASLWDGTRGHDCHSGCKPLRTMLHNMAVELPLLILGKEITVRFAHCGNSTAAENFDRRYTDSKNCMAFGKKKKTNIISKINVNNDRISVMVVHKTP